MHSQLKCTRTDLLKIRLLTRLKTFQTSPELASSLAGAVFAGVGAGFRWLLLFVGGSLFSLAVAGRSCSLLELVAGGPRQLLVGRGEKEDGEEEGEKGEGERGGGGGVDTARFSPESRR
ncbi:hypothetical protein KY284_032635 [Solanum tuberosum]|nr:hypothetical protein KY284_032635 [Solanum tuberosum]